jgi:hypothetical protein
VDGVSAFRFGVELADRAFGGLGRIGRADHLAKLGHRTLGLQDHRDDGPGRHEFDELVVERAAMVHRVERSRLGLVERQHLERADGEAGALEVGEDRSRLARSHGVRFDDR